MPFATRRCARGSSSNPTASTTAWWAAPSANLKETFTHEPHQRRPPAGPANATTKSAGHPAAAGPGRTQTARHKPDVAVGGGRALCRRLLFLENQSLDILR